jgi:hypothetical protein
MKIAFMVSNNKGCPVKALSSVIAAIFVALLTRLCFCADVVEMPDLEGLVMPDAITREVIDGAFKECFNVDTRRAVFAAAVLMTVPERLASVYLELAWLKSTDPTVRAWIVAHFTLKISHREKGNPGFWTLIQKFSEVEASQRRSEFEFVKSNIAGYGARLIDMTSNLPRIDWMPVKYRENLKAYQKRVLDKDRLRLEGIVPERP